MAKATSKSWKDDYDQRVVAYVGKAAAAGHTYQLVESGLNVTDDLVMCIKKVLWYPTNTNDLFDVFLNPGERLYYWLAFVPNPPNSANYFASNSAGLLHQQAWEGRSVAPEISKMLTIPWEMDFTWRKGGGMLAHPSLLYVGCGWDDALNNAFYSYVEIFYELIKVSDNMNRELLQQMLLVNKIGA
jgi:hypothetical protein